MYDFSTAQFAHANDDESSDDGFVFMMRSYAKVKKPKRIMGKSAHRNDCSHLYNRTVQQRQRGLVVSITPRQPTPPRSTPGDRSYFWPRETKSGLVW
jgi:hypothetical protein